VVFGSASGCRPWTWTDGKWDHKKIHDHACLQLLYLRKKCLEQELRNDILEKYENSNKKFLNAKEVGGLLGE
jgi:hypothetical protein